MKKSKALKMHGATYPKGPFRKLAHMRAKGWTVAVHNDYRQGGQFMTFWLFTHPTGGHFVKGEGRTDDVALAECMRSASWFEAMENIK
jgi:hypothetical protein